MRGKEPERGILTPGQENPSFVAPTATIQPSQETRGLPAYIEQQQPRFIEMHKTVVNASYLVLSSELVTG